MKPITEFHTLTTDEIQSALRTGFEVIPHSLNIPAHQSTLAQETMLAEEREAEG